MLKFYSSKSSRTFRINSIERTSNFASEWKRWDTQKWSWKGFIAELQIRFINYNLSRQWPKSSKFLSSTFNFLSGQWFDEKHHQVGKGNSREGAIRCIVSNAIGKSSATCGNRALQRPRPRNFNARTAVTQGHLPQANSHDRSGS